MGAIRVNEEASEETPAIGAPAAAVEAITSSPPAPALVKAPNARGGTLLVPPPLTVLSAESSIVEATPPPAAAANATKRPGANAEQRKAL